MEGELPAGQTVGSVVSYLHPHHHLQDKYTKLSINKQNYIETSTFLDFTFCGTDLEARTAVLVQDGGQVSEGVHCG